MTADEPDADDDAETTKKAHEEEIFRQLGQRPLVGGQPQGEQGERRSNDPNYAKP